MIPAAGIALQNKVTRALVQLLDKRLGDGATSHIVRALSVLLDGIQLSDEIQSMKY